MELRYKARIVVLFSPLVAIGLIWVSGRQGAMIGGIPVFDVCIVVAFLIQWLAFVPAFFYQTEHYFDLSGSLTYIFVAILALIYGAANDPRGVVICLLIMVWALRLGWFLFTRIKKSGFDSRFKDIMPDWSVYLMTWTLQAIWVSITASCALVAVTSTNKIPLDSWAVFGITLWSIGFLIEVVADQQKRAFRAEVKNAGKFICSGLWSWSRHPNYLGEMMLWLGIAIIAFPVLSGWQLATLGSPVFVCYLLIKVSGVEMLERQNDSTWGSDPDYLAYKNRTSTLLPLPKIKPSAQSFPSK